MIVNISDAQIVSETQTVLLTLIQPAPINAAVIMTNAGVNTINFDWQEWDGSTWDDLNTVGNPLNSTLSPGQTVLVQVQSSNSKVQLLGNASGGALLVFGIQRYFNRQSGGAIPILSL
jgi:hypothetical protein